MTNCLRHADFESTRITEFEIIPELANQPSREQCKLAVQSEHEITGEKDQLSFALQVKENVSHLIKFSPFISESKWKCF